MMIVKPAQQTPPLTTAALAGVLAEAGLPDGVLNIVPTSRAGALTELLIRDGRLRKLSFTGSDEYLEEKYVAIGVGPVQDRGAAR